MCGADWVRLVKGCAVTSIIGCDCADIHLLRDAARHELTRVDAEIARGLLDWSQQKLSETARVGIVTIGQLEAGKHEPRRSTLDVVRRCFEIAGIDFIDENGGGAGVRLSKRLPRRLPGQR
jgi:hypothetical protein